VDVLAVCTGNICRSPAAAAFLGRRLALFGTDAIVHSSGLLDAGRPIPRRLVKQLARWDLSIDESLRIPLTVEAIADADIILGLERGHVRSIVLMEPDATHRTFSLKEFVRRGEERGPADPDQPLDEWLKQLAAGRVPTDLIGASVKDDVADPYGQSRRAYRRAVAEIEDLSSRAARLLPGRRNGQSA
jgi:protein-tyrosine phosphatase